MHCTWGKRVALCVCVCVCVWERERERERERELLFCLCHLQTGVCLLALPLRERLWNNAEFIWSHILRKPGVTMKCKFFFLGAWWNISCLFELAVSGRAITWWVACGGSCSRRQLLQSKPVATILHFLCLYLSCMALNMAFQFVLHFFVWNCDLQNIENGNGTQDFSFLRTR
jgi:hypothetical protein